MVSIPSLGSMLLVVGIALAITVVVVAALASLLTVVTERRHPQGRSRNAGPQVPTQHAQHAQHTQVTEPAARELASTRS
jgi:hypothetical protein